jgi:hypothetical protein
MNKPHWVIDCSEHFSRRATSAIDTSPAITLNMIRTSSSAGISGDLPIVNTSIRTQPTDLPTNLACDAKRQNSPQART